MSLRPKETRKQTTKLKPQVFLHGRKFQNVYFFFSSVSGGKVFRWCPIYWVTPVHCNLCKYDCVSFGYDKSARIVSIRTDKNFDSGKKAKFTQFLTVERAPIDCLNFFFLRLDSLPMSRPLHSITCH